MGYHHAAGKAVADFTYATRLRNRNNQVETNPLWLSASANAFSADNLITANLESMLLPVAGAIETLPDSPFTVEPLVQSSTNNQMVDALDLTTCMWAPCGGISSPREPCETWPCASRAPLKPLFPMESRRVNPKQLSRHQKD
jgi:ABC-type uncharacterized transport system involved in gliding motility auxiliary subunit